MPHQAKSNEYHNSVWFSENTITNIIVLSKLHLQYLINYKNNNTMYIVHRESEGKPNMNFRMHESGLHYFKPRNKEFIF